MGGNATHHHIAMAHDIFGGRQDGQVDSLVERGMKIRCRPCVIEQRHYIALFRRSADRRDILHFEGQATG